MNVSPIGSTNLSSILSGMTGRMQKPSASDMAAHILAQEDQDQSGTISAGDTKIASERFGQMDTDGDGQLTTEELEASFQTFEADRAQRMTGMQGPPPPPKPEEMVSSIMEQQDADENGVLSAEESGLESDLFSAIDTDSSGTLTSEEVLAGIEANRPERPEGMEAPPRPEAPQSAGSSASSSDTDLKTLLEVLAQNEASAAYSDQSWIYSLMQSSGQSLAVSA